MASPVWRVLTWTMPSACSAQIVKRGLNCLPDGHSLRHSVGTRARLRVCGKRGAGSVPSAPATTFEVDIYSAIVDSIELRPSSIAQAEQNQALAEDLAGQGMSAGSKPWTIAAIHAFGMAQRSEIWISSVSAYAEAANDAFRRADVAALDFATRARAALVEPDDERLRAAPRNMIAHWRVEVTRLYLPLLRRHRADAATALGALRDLNPRSGSSDLGFRSRLL